MDNCWTISCQVMAYMKKVYIDLIIINLYKKHHNWYSSNMQKLPFFAIPAQKTKGLKEQGFGWSKTEVQILLIET